MVVPGNGIRISSSRAALSLFTELIHYIVDSVLNKRVIIDILPCGQCASGWYITKIQFVLSRTSCIPRVPQYNWQSLWSWKRTNGMWECAFFPPSLLFLFNFHQKMIEYPVTTNNATKNLRTEITQWKTMRNELITRFKQQYDVFWVT